MHLKPLLCSQLMKANFDAALLLQQHSVYVYKKGETDKSNSLNKG